MRLLATVLLVGVIGGGQAAPECTAETATGSGFYFVIDHTGHSSLNDFNVASCNRPMDECYKSDCKITFESVKGIPSMQWSCDGVDEKRIAFFHPTCLKKNAKINDKLGIPFNDGDDPLTMKPTTNASSSEASPVSTLSYLMATTVIVLGTIVTLTS